MAIVTAFSASVHSNSSTQITKPPPQETDGMLKSVKPRLQLSTVDKAVITVSCPFCQDDFAQPVFFLDHMRSDRCWSLPNGQLHPTKQSYIGPSQGIELALFAAWNRRCLTTGQLSELRARLYGLYFEAKDGSKHARLRLHILEKQSSSAIWQIAAEQTLHVSVLLSPSTPLIESKYSSKAFHIIMHERAREAKHGVCGTWTPTNKLSLIDHPPLQLEDVPPQTTTDTLRDVHGVPSSALGAIEAAYVSDTQLNLAYSTPAVCSSSLSQSTTYQDHTKATASCSDAVPNTACPPLPSINTHKPCDNPRSSHSGEAATLPYRASPHMVTCSGSTNGTTGDMSHGTSPQGGKAARNEKRCRSPSRGDDGDVGGAAHQVGGSDEGRKKRRKKPTSSSLYCCVICPGATATNISGITRAIENHHDAIWCNICLRYIQIIPQNNDPRTKAERKEATREAHQYCCDVHYIDPGTYEIFRTPHDGVKTWQRLSDVQKYVLLSREARPGSSPPDLIRKASQPVDHTETRLVPTPVQLPRALHLPVHVAITPTTSIEAIQNNPETSNVADQDSYVSLMMAQWEIDDLRQQLRDRQLTLELCAAQLLHSGMPMANALLQQATRHMPNGPLSLLDNMSDGQRMAATSAVPMAAGVALQPRQADEPFTGMMQSQYPAVVLPSAGPSTDASRRTGRTTTSNAGMVTSRTSLGCSQDLSDHC
ncbi:hypothetical protein AMS68_000129 [Peltaster fructicola]|uniref:Uncharacterized protein n=1 Tax=Peltaster fructicola TaxID=286661 RepID=A0A6H0XIR8_9PEZI|nr:hypothetical protein AMS68_000129 [Peltaster fructicola]